MSDFPRVEIQDNSRGQVGDEKLIVGALFNYATFHHLKIKVIIDDWDVIGGKDE